MMELQQLAVSRVVSVVFVFAYRGKQRTERDRLLDLGARESLCDNCAHSSDGP